MLCEIPFVGNGKHYTVILVERQQQMLKNFTAIIERVKLVQNGMSTVAFAKTLGMTQQTVDQYLKLKNKPSLEFVMNVCSAFTESADWILGFTDTRNSVSRVPNIVKGNQKRHIQELKASAERVVTKANELLTSIDEMEQGL
jgi:predicted transcriptional regulator